MVFGFKKDRNEQEQEVKDPTLIWEFSKGIKIFPNELWAAGFGAKALNYLRTHDPPQMGTVHMQGPGRAAANFSRAYSSGGALGVAAMMHNTNASRNVPAAQPGKAARPEIIADKFVLTTDVVKALFGREVMLEGAYNQKYIETKLRGAKGRNDALIKAAIPEPDATKNGQFYTSEAMAKVYNIEKGSPSGFWSIGVLVGISAKEGGTFSDNEFMLHIASINNHLVITPKYEKNPSLLKLKFKHVNDGEYSFTWANEIDKNATVIEYKVRIGDKDDKKQGIDIYKKMTDFVAETQPKVNETLQYAFVKTEKDDKLLLSEQLIKDLNA